MNIISALIGVIAPVFLVTAAGYLWGLRRMEFDHALITRLVTVLGAPAMVFSTFTTMTLDPARAWGLVEASLLAFAACVVIGIGVLRFFSLSYRVYLPSLIFPNIGNMGLPICLLAFGQSGLALAMIYFAVVTVLQFSLGPIIASGQARWTAPLKVPFIYAVAAAALVKYLDWPVPDWIASTVQLFAGMTIPLMLLSLGVALAQLRAPNLARTTGLSVLRLAMGAAVGWAVSRILGLDAAAQGVVIVQSSMPVAIFNFLFARLYDNQPDEVAGLVLISTLLSYISLPILVALAM